MEFYVHLIKVADGQTPKAELFLRQNCTHIVLGHWFYEGELFCLDDAGVSYKALGEEPVPLLGGLGRDELIEVCKDRFYADPAKGCER